MHSLRSVSYLQSALTNYLHSCLTLLEAEFTMIDQQTIADSVYKIMKNVNQLQRLMDEKIKMFLKEYSEAEVEYLFTKYSSLNEKKSLDYIKSLYSLSRKCFQANEEKEKIAEHPQSNKEKGKMTKRFWSNGEKEKITNEFNQFFLTHKKQRKRLNEFQMFQNDINNVWVVEQVCCQIPFKPCCCNEISNPIDA